MKDTTDQKKSSVKRPLKQDGSCGGQNFNAWRQGRGTVKANNKFQKHMGGTCKIFGTPWKGKVFYLWADTQEKNFIAKEQRMFSTKSLKKTLKSRESDVLLDTRDSQEH